MGKNTNITTDTAGEQLQIVTPPTANADAIRAILGVHAREFSAEDLDWIAATSNASIVAHVLSRVRLSWGNAHAVAKTLGRWNATTPAGATPLFFTGTDHAMWMRVCAIGGAALGNAFAPEGTKSHDGASASWKNARDRMTRIAAIVTPEPAPREIPANRPYDPAEESPGAIEAEIDQAEEDELTKLMGGEL